MGKIVHREVIRGRMTVTQVRREKGEEYEAWVPVSIFSDRSKPVTKRHPGRTYVEVLVYSGPQETGEPIEWEMPLGFRYELVQAARIAEREAPREEKS
jgi:hypothetical protein